MAMAMATIRKPVKVLLIEDDATNAFMIETLLDSSMRIEVTRTTVASLTSSLVLLEKQVFDIIVADLLLPDSQNAIETVKVLASVTDTPILVCSGVDMTDKEIASIYEAGAKRYLPKLELSVERLDEELELTLLARQIKDERKRSLEVQQELRKVCAKAKGEAADGYDNTSRSPGRN